jgi:Histidine kinase
MGALTRTNGPLSLETRSCLGVICFLLVVMLSGCGAHRDSGKPSIEMTRVPRADKGGSAELATIAGRVVGATGEQQIVLFARSGAWYVQPFADQPFTKTQPDSTWSNSTHLGTEYAALLVEPGFVPPPLTAVLPNEGNGVIAVVVVEGTPPFWATSWFRLLLALVVLVALLALYRWRLHEISRQLNLRFEERLAERTRIAQDLHDTLLQGVVSASMQLHVANEQLPADSPAKPTGDSRNRVFV